mgnify:CR=1 FL=1
MLQYRLPASILPAIQLNKILPKDIMDPIIIEFVNFDFDYEKIAFNAVDDEGVEIYHTNVMMALGEDIAIICLDTVRDDKERNALVAKLRETGKAIVEITISQMKAFAGNMLQVRNKEGETFLVMSEQAFESLNAEQVEKIETHTSILSSPIPTIEALGGGSARCMMAEVFYPGMS